jgi:hypothetical protein
MPSRAPGIRVSVVSNRHSVRPRDEIAAFLRLELQTTRLDAIFDHLWLAGIKAPVRGVRQQLVLRPEIIVTEDINKHLIADYTVIFAKPLPGYLLSVDFWKTHLCGDDGLTP